MSETISEFVLSATAMLPRGKSREPIVAWSGDARA
jgi:hypothetical protein